MKKVGCSKIGLMLVGFIFVLALPSVSQTCVEPSTDIIAWWPFDETSGTVVEDIVGNNPGIHVNNPVHSEGNIGGALRFDGNDYVGVADNDLWAFGSNDFTVELWANWDSPGGGSIGHPGDIFIGNDEGPGWRRKWFFALGGGYLNFHINSPSIGPRFFPRAPFSPIVGQWYHLAVTRNGNTYTIFVDGQPAATATESHAVPNANAPLTIGQAEGLGYMNGRLDEITIYNRALSQEELQAIYEADSEGKCKNLDIATESLSVVQYGEYSSQTLEAVFGEPPCSWSIADGSVPSGMVLDPNGVLSGTPTEAGDFPVTIRVTDENDDVAEKTFALEVLLTLPPPTISIHKSGTVAVPGREVDYFILVENKGNITARNLELLELLNPFHFSLISTDPTPVADIAVLSEASIILWDIGELLPGEAQIFSYQATLNPSVPLGTVVSGGPACTGVDLAVSWAQCLKSALEAYPTCAVCAPLCTICAPLCGLPEFGECPLCILGCFRCLVGTPGPGGSSCLENVWNTAKDCYDAYKESEECSSDDKPAIGALDPNKKLVLARRFIQPGQLLVYAIHYENIGEIEARDVFLTDVLDSNLDTSTLDIISADGSSFDPATRTLRWELFDRNLEPGETDYVMFSIKPLDGLASETEIYNDAVIQFEVFDPCQTNEVVNIIDTDPPTSVMDPLPPETSTTEFTISWIGIDPVGEIDTYSIFVSVDGGGFVPFIERTHDTSVLFTGERGRTYEFVSIATDTAGNVEVKEPIAEAVTYILENSPPVADAGENVQIASSEQSDTVLCGTANDSDADALQYRWFEGQNVLLDWTDVDPNGRAYLNLGNFPFLALGGHPLTLEVTDGQATASDEMILTIDNSPPEAQPAPSYQVVEVGIDPIVVVADVSDFDGDILIYEWRKEGITLQSGVVQTVQGGGAVPVPDFYRAAGDPAFGVDVHEVELRVNDGINGPVSEFVCVEVTDTTKPSLSPIPSVTILWPPNHELHEVTIWANAFDNGGGAIHLSVEVQSSEPADADGDGSTIPDYYIDSVDDATGVIELRLRAERSGKGEGRIYTIVITATDASDNQSVAQVEITAPHDRRKK